jgi:hypothetical protein
MPNPSLKNVIFTCLFKMLNHLRFISKNLSSIENDTVRQKLVLERRLVYKKKKTVFWSSLFAQTQVTYLTFIFLTLQTLTQLKTTFGAQFWQILLGVQNVAWQFFINCFKR